MRGGVFICYRREDSAGFARLIYDRLTKRLGRKHVFVDVNNIPLGSDFVDVLSERVGACTALIAIIGRGWLSIADEANRRRLDDPDDFVRFEIEAALARGVRVIPVLVDGAAMPRPDDLPDSLKKLTRRQAIEISNSRFDSDVERLTHALSLIEDELRQREVAEVARAEEARHQAEAESARRPEDPRPAGEAAEAERAAREERERQEAAELARAEEGRRLAEERRAREAAEAERAAREERKKREGAQPVELAMRAGALRHYVSYAWADESDPDHEVGNRLTRMERCFVSNYANSSLYCFFTKPIDVVFMAIVYLFFLAINI
jgi:hypothetical protein